MQGYYRAKPAIDVRRLAGQFKLVLLARGNTPKHAEDTYKRIVRVMDLAGIRSERQLRRATVELAIGALRGSLSLVTCNHHIRACKSFTRWAADEEHVGRDVLRAMRLLPSRHDARHPRRAPSRTETQRLMAATVAGPSRYGMTAAARVCLYETALYSGLRSREIRSLCVGSINFDVSPASIFLEGRAAKNRRPTHQPIPIALAQRLRAVSDGQDARAPLFRMPCACNVVRMLRADLRAAEVPYRTEAGYFDFHAFRHAFITRLIELGTSIKVVQQLARLASVDVLMNRYAHSQPAAATAALELLMRVGRAGIEPATHGFSDRVPAAPGKPLNNKAIPTSPRRSHGGVTWHSCSADRPDHRSRCARRGKRRS